MTATVPAAAVTGLLQAISDQLIIPPGRREALGYRLATQDAMSRVRLAIEALLQDGGLQEDRVVMFTRLLAGAPERPVYAEPPGVQCAPGRCTCGGHVTADGVFHAAGAA